MKNLIASLKNLFKKPMTVSEVLDIYGIMEKDYTEVWTIEVAGHKFKVLYRVVDENNGYKTLADGFETKGEARDYAHNIGKNAIYYPYNVEVK